MSKKRITKTLHGVIDLKENTHTITDDNGEVLLKNEYKPSTTVAITLVDGRQVMGEKRVVNNKPYVEVVEDGVTTLYHKEGSIYVL